MLHFLFDVFWWRQQIFLRSLGRFEGGFVELIDGGEAGVPGQLHLEDGRGGGRLPGLHVAEFLRLKTLNTLEQTLDSLLGLNIFCTR